MTIQRGIKAVYGSNMDGGSWGFRLALDERIWIEGTGFLTDTDARDTAREIGKELALIIIGLDPEGGAK